MSSIFALVVLAGLGFLVFGAPLYAAFEIARIASRSADKKPVLEKPKKCSHERAVGAVFCPDCGARVARHKPAQAADEQASAVAVQAPNPQPQKQADKEQDKEETTGVNPAIVEAMLADLAKGLKSLGYDKETIKLKCAALKPMAVGGATLNQLINEALKR